MITFLGNIKDFLEKICAMYMPYIYSGISLGIIILIFLILILPISISIICMPFLSFIFSKILITNKHDKNILYSVLIGCLIVLFCSIFIFIL